MPDELTTTQVVATQEPIIASGMPATGPVDEAPDPARLQADIVDLQQKRDKAREDAEYWRKQKAEARRDYFRREEPPPTPTPASTLAVDPKEPNKRDFDDYDKYMEAVADYRAQKKITEWRQQEAREREQQSQQARVSTLQEKLNSGFEAHEDFGEVVFNETVPITAVVADILTECENPAEVAYYLGKNRADAIRISRLTPIQAAREITRIEERIKQAGTPPPNPPPKIPGAPPPINALGSNNSPVRDLEKMSTKEFEAEMQRRTGRRW